MFIVQELQATVDSLTSREEASQQQKLLLSGEKQKMISELQTAISQLTHKVYTSFYPAYVPHDMDSCVQDKPSKLSHVF